MKLPPLEVMATWPTPNYVDPPTRGHGVLVVNIICICLAFLVVMLRLYTRIRITCSFGVDDVFITLGLVFAIAMVFVTSYATENWAWNRHVWDIPIGWLPNVQKLNLAFQLMFSWSSSTTKISLLVFCRRLLGAGKGGYMILNCAFIGLIIIVTLSPILFTSISIFQCSPMKAYWEVDPKYPHKCMNDGAMVFSASVINIVTDFLSTTLPMPLIWSLKLPIRQRLAVISIFGLGIFVNVAGSVRTVYVWRSMVIGYDKTWLGWPILVSAAVEISLGLICSSAPALRPLIVAFLPHLLQSTRNPGSSYNQRGHSLKLWSSNSRPRNSHMVMGVDRHAGYESDRFEIIRTMEIESFSESRITNDNTTGHGYDVSAKPYAISLDKEIDLKQIDTMFTSSASHSSSASRSLDKDSPFADQPGR